MTKENISKSQNDLYEVLGLEPEATASDIKRSFRKLSVTFHPDKIDKSFPQEKIDQLNKKYEMITLAFTILSNDNTRKEYDQMYYMEKRNENFFTLKDRAKESLNVSYHEKGDSAVFLRKQKELVEERHKQLEQSYKPRSLEEYNSKRERQFKDIKLNSVDQESLECKKIITKIEPTAIMPSKLDNYQTINDVGNMYKDIEFDLDDFTINNIDTSIEIQDVDTSIKKYNENTESFKNIGEDEFEVTSQVLLDKIIR